MDSCPCPRTLHSCLPDLGVEWKNDVVELDFPNVWCGKVRLVAKEQQTRGGCSGGKLRNTTLAFDVGFAMARNVGGSLEEVVGY